MKNTKTLFSILTIIIITWVVAFIYEPKLPDPVPTHWNAAGEADGFTGKPWGVFMLPIVATVIGLLLFLLPKISPKGFKLDSARKAYDIIVLVVLVFMSGVMVLSFEAGLNNEVNIVQWVMAAMGLLFVMIGNYLTKVPKNFFLGIRTPWTLASDEVWYKTHRLGSWAFVLCGLTVILLAFLSVSVNWIIGLQVAAGLIPSIYSLVIYKKIEGFSEDEKT